jgi:hypothetical protein
MQRKIKRNGAQLGLGLHQSQRMADRGEVDMKIRCDRDGSADVRQ